MIRDLLEFVGILPDWKERKKREELAAWGKPTTPDGKAPHKPQRPPRTPEERQRDDLEFNARWERMVTDMINNAVENGKFHNNPQTSPQRPTATPNAHVNKPSGNGNQSNPASSNMKKENPYEKLHELYAPHLPKMDIRDNPTARWCHRGYHKETLTKQSSYDRARAVEENLEMLRRSLGDKFTLIRVENLPASNKGFTAVFEYEVAYD